MRMAFGKAAFLLGAAALALPGAGWAQVRDLDRESSDVRVYQGNVSSAPAVFEVTVPADRSLRIDALATSELDPVLRVYDARSNELLVEDDDGGGELNSRATIYGEARGRRIRIEVDSYEAEWVEEGGTYGGAFDLRLATLDLRPVGIRAIDYGGRMTGTLQGEENLFTIAGRAGERVEIALISAEDGTLDPYLELRNAAGEAIATNDDNGQNLNSLITHVFDDSGTYTIAASGYGSSTGDYTLRVRERREGGGPLPLQTVGIGEEATGEVSPGFAEDGAPLTIDYRLSDAARQWIAGGGGEVTIHMNATGEGDPDFGGALDPYVDIGFDTPLGFAAVDGDDDGSGTLDSLLPVDLSSLAGHPDLLDALRIRVQGYGGTAGGYTLTITEGLEERVTGYGDFEEWEEGFAPPTIMTVPSE